MINLNTYIIEKLHLNKDIKRGWNQKTWLKHCEQTIFNYLDDQAKVKDYKGEYEISYSNGQLKVVFYEPIPYVTISKFGGELFKKLELEGLIESEPREDVLCKNNKWTIIFNINDEMFR